MDTISEDDMYALIDAANTFGRIYMSHSMIFGISAYSIHTSYSEVCRLSKLFDLPIVTREYTPINSEIVYFQAHVTLFGVDFHSQDVKGEENE